MPTADHRDVPFVEAKTVTGGPAYTRGRPDGPPIWVVIHDMEFPERTDAAEWTAEYFAGRASRDGRSVSSHYCADSDSVVQCVRLSDVAWTVGNRPGNYRGINWELAGYASQTPAQWLDAFSSSMFARVAVIMRRDMDTYNIPARLLSDAQVEAFTSGVTSHAQLGRCFGGTDHTDPGKSFPWAHLLDLLGGPPTSTGDDDMPTVQEIADAVWAKNLVGFGPDPKRYSAVGSQLDAVSAARDSNEHQLPALAAKLDALASKVDQILGVLAAAGPSLEAIRKVVDEELDEQARAGADPD